MLRILFVLFGLLLSTCLTFAHAADPLSIKVIDSSTQEELIGVIVFNQNRSFSDVTDINGVVEIPQLNPGDSLYFELSFYDVAVIAYGDLESGNRIVEMQLSAYNLNEFVVESVSKWQDRAGDVPASIDIIRSDEIAYNGSQTSADVLEQTGNVFIQKSQMGGGSPVIRGFEANKVLIVLDGVRMNNAIYRNGHLQNVISIDNSSLDRVEVVYGPASVIYGSDALGGVMHFYTKRPQLNDRSDSYLLSGTAATRYSMANQERHMHIDLNYGKKRWASLTSLSFSKYGDLRMGALYNSQNAPIPNRDYYVGQTINQKDTVFENPNPLKQIGTSYSQIDALQKFRYVPNEAIDLTLNVQYSTTSDVPRFDELSLYSFEMSNDSIQQIDFKFAEWFYGPQTRMFSSADLLLTPEENRFLDKAKFIAAWQRIDEDRIRRRFDSEWRTIQEEDVNVFSLNADAKKRLTKTSVLQYGVEATHNIVQSRASRFNVKTEEVEQRANTRYPDGGSTMTTAAAYANLEFEFIKRKLTMTAGARFTQVFLSANFVDTTLFQLPYSDINRSLNAFTGSLAFNYQPGKNWTINMIGSTAFRAPNVDDFAKVRSNSGFVTIPNPGLDAEYSVNGEISIEKQISSKVKISGTYYYTYLFDAIVRRTTDIEGDTLLYYDGEFDRVIMNDNAGEAFIYGVSGNIYADIVDGLVFKAGVNYQLGKNITDASPLSHIPPLYGYSSLSYQNKRFKGEFRLKYNGWKRIEDFDLDGSDNAELATVNGTPAWMTLNVYSQFRITDFLSLNISIENIADVQYRPFSSGVSAPGRNLILGIRGSF